MENGNKITIALAGNPNCGKTTLFNELTGSNQFVGNWPGVTVEKKEGKLKKHEGVTVTDLPGIYSLSPYTLEEVVARKYLIGDNEEKKRPDVILNVIDATNLERNLYLTTQLVELGIPVVVALNMIDVVKKNGDVIKTKELENRLGCKVVEISALKKTGITEAAEEAVKAALKSAPVPQHSFSGVVEHALAHIEEAAVHEMPEEQQRWYAIKVFERDDKVMNALNLSESVKEHIEADIKAAEKELDDDAESIITNERYVYIAELLKTCYKKKKAGELSTSDKIDRVVTNRWAALPIFAAIMFLVYFISVTTVGGWVTDWTNDGLFGDGWHLFGMGITGTDVTKNVADMVLADDNFATIVFAVGEGRRIYDNIRKAIQFLLSSNMSEVLTIFTAEMIGFTVLKAPHLLWINLITDCLPALALGMEPAEKDVMTKKPRSSTDGIFSGGVGFDTLYQSVLVTILTLVAYLLGSTVLFDPNCGTAEMQGMTMAFLTMSMAEIFHSYNMRSQRGSIFTLGSRNFFLLGAMILSLVLTTIVIEVPFLASLFEFATIDIAEYATALGLAILVIPVVEAVKAIQRARAKHKNN